ncbi:MAG: AI-2E family transporter [Pseudomonadota bacterium]
MTVHTRGTFYFWLALLFVVVAALFVFKSVLMPFGVGLILAFVLDPLADRFQRMNLSRAMATTIVFSSLFLAIALILFLIVPILANQVTEFAQSMPEIIKAVQTFAAEQIVRIKTAVGPQLSAKLQNLPNPFDAFIRDAALTMVAFLTSIWSSGQAVFNTISLLIITPIVACYLLYDWDRMVAHIDRFIPRRDVAAVRKIAREINAVLASYLRGQALICIILGSIYAAGLAIIGLNFALLIGLMSGLVCFVPYLGNILGLGTALLVAVAQFGADPTKLIFVAAVYGTGQMIDGYVLQPKLLSNAVGIHPVWLIFALYAFGLLFGFTGVLLAVPMAACTNVLFKHALDYYSHTQLYQAKSRTAKAEKATA